MIKNITTNIFSWLNVWSRTKNSGEDIMNQLLKGTLILLISLGASSSFAEGRNYRNGRGGGPSRPGPGYSRPGNGGPNRPAPNYDRWNDYHRRYGSGEGWIFGRNYRYERYNHIPYRNIPRGHYTYHSPGDFFRVVPYRNIYWNHWVRWRIAQPNGYFWYDSYPWFVYNGFQHRYSDQDVCNYELVDGNQNQAVQTYYGQYCNVGYDRCAYDRDAANYQIGEYRYFCSEKVDDNCDYDWDYNDDYYSDNGNNYDN